MRSSEILLIIVKIKASNDLVKGKHVKIKDDHQNLTRTRKKKKNNSCGIAKKNNKKI